jgi:hypothetical protein
MKNQIRVGADGKGEINGALFDVHATRVSEDNNHVFTLCEDIEVTALGGYSHDAMMHNAAKVTCRACIKLIAGYVVHLRPSNKRANVCKRSTPGRHMTDDRFYTPSPDATTCTACRAFYRKAVEALTTAPDWRPAAAIAEDAYAL